MRLTYTKTFGNAFSVAVIPTLKDNFSYLIHDQTTGALAAVDVNSDWKPLKQHLEQLQYWGSPEHRMQAILSTHKHFDHAGGNSTFSKEVKSSWRPDAVEGEFRIYGGIHDNIPAVTHVLHGGDVLHIGALQVKVLDVPCHTKGHVAYHVSHPQHSSGSALFTGDTLFIGGLGAFFEGTDKDMCVAMARLGSVNQNDAAADAKTCIFPGHEYTEGFLKFAVSTYPEKSGSEHQFLVDQQQRYKALVSSGMPSVPSTLAEEKRQNLFLRGVVDPAFRKAMNKGSEVELMNFLYNACD